MPDCKLCHSTFPLDPWDLAFYAKVSPVLAGRTFSIPPPRLCPLCRAQRRYLWRGELHLFKGKSALSGKDIISYYPPASPHKVYSNEEWWGDGWDPFAFGRPFDFSRPFFEQFGELMREAPVPARAVQAGQENCDYTNSASWNKNCYLLGGANYDEDCLYGNYVNHCKSSVDNNFIDGCELCYDCVDCANCYALRYSTDCRQCSDAYFLLSCRGCRSCFGSVNLVNAQHYFFNEPLSPGAYGERLRELELHKRSSTERLWRRFDAHRLKFPHKYRIGELNENATGSAINGCKDSFDCFDATELRDCRFCHWLHKAHDCMDIIAWGFPAELCYECMEAGAGAYRLLFSACCYGSSDTLYSYHTQYSKHCFGCAGIRKGEHCIFNVRYSHAEYERLAAKIAAHMQATGEWGEFFPHALAPLAYNTSIAMDYFPLQDTQARALGCRWHNEETFPESSPLIRSTVPDDLNAASDDVCAHVLRCAASGRPFKIIKPELDFYRREGIPLPDRSFYARHQARLARRTPRMLWERNCAQCGAPLATPYAPNRPERIVCTQCYERAVY